MGEKMKSLTTEEIQYAIHAIRKLGDTTTLPDIERNRLEIGIRSVIQSLVFTNEIISLVLSKKTGAVEQKIRPVPISVEVLQGMKKKAPQFYYEDCQTEPIEVEADREGYNAALDAIIKKLGGV